MSSAWDSYRRVLNLSVDHKTHSLHSDQHQSYSRVLVNQYNMPCHEQNSTAAVPYEAIKKRTGSSHLSDMPASTKIALIDNAPCRTRVSSQY